MDAPEAPPLPQLPQAPAPPPMFGEQQKKKKPKRQSTMPTFLGTGQAEQGNPANTGQKTLLGA